MLDSVTLVTKQLARVRLVEMIYTNLRSAFCVCILLVLTGCSDSVFQSQKRISSVARQYSKVEFSLVLNETFENPYDQREVTVDMILQSPSGKSLRLPCYFEKNENGKSFWKARFAPQELGRYSYRFERTRNGSEKALSSVDDFVSEPSGKDGFLHAYDLWTLRFDSGKPFRGIGENVGWEPRSFSDQKFTYDYLLPRLSKYGANFFRSWMSPNNFPLEWKTVRHTKRYQDTNEYFNPGGAKRLDEIVEMADSLGLYMMLAFDSHNALIEGNQWEIHNYNQANGGPAKTPTEFFTLEESRQRYKNRLRYIVARWGYATSIAAWEFFNEIDNAAFSKRDSIIIPHEAIVSWHREMAEYLRGIDPYDHIVTTSVSHRQIEGLYEIDAIDINQMHIYKRTHQIPRGVVAFTREYKKPFVWGEFAYEWDWNKDFSVIAEELDFDYKRGLWYGLFSPTPILPMSWWWELFDERGLTPYFQGVRQISDRMLQAGNGSFETIKVQADDVEVYGVRCGESVFVYILNNSQRPCSTGVLIEEILVVEDISVEVFDPSIVEYRAHSDVTSENGKILINGISLPPGGESVVILTSKQFSEEQR